MKYYAFHSTAGRGTRHANSGKLFGRVYSYSSEALRDRHCLEFTAPNHCPQADLAPILAADARGRDIEPRILVRVEHQGKEPFERFDDAFWYQDPQPGNCYAENDGEITVIG